MKKLLATTAIALAGIALAAASHAATPAKYDWTTDGGDNARSGWNQKETILTKANIKGLKLRWVEQTDNAPRAVDNLFPALVIGNLQTASGVKEVTFVSGVSDNLYAFESDTGKLLWRRSWGYVAGGGRGGGGGGRGAPAAANAPPPAPPAPSFNTTPQPASNFLQPGGSTDVPVIGPARADGKRPIYFITGDGVLNIMDAATGQDLEAPFYFQNGKNWALTLYTDPQGHQWIYDQSIYASSSMAVTRLDDPTHQVLTLPGLGGGAWGRRGLAVDDKGRIFATSGDGNVNETSRANSVVSAEVQDGKLVLRDWFTPVNWAYMWHRDLDPNNTPTIFTYQGKEMLAASGKECRLTLIDADNMGGGAPDHSKPLYQTPLICNAYSDFQDHGSWGALSSWQDSAGVRWVLIPFWGPATQDVKFPVVNTPVTNLGGIAAFKVQGSATAPTLAPAWVSHDMDHGEPAIIANGMVFVYGSGEFTRQGWPDTGSLSFDFRGRVAGAHHLTLYVLDATTGKELWNSGNTVTSWNHFSGVTVANGKVYVGTYDGKFYCFSL